MAEGREGEGSVSETQGLELNGRYWSHEEDAAMCREIPKADKEGEKYPGFSFLLTISLAKCIREQSLKTHLAGPVLLRGEQNSRQGKKESEGKWASSGALFRGTHNRVNK